MAPAVRAPYTNDMNKTGLCGLLVAAGVAVTAAQAMAQTSTTLVSSPVAVSNVYVQALGASSGGGTGSVSVTFINESKVVATEIVFELDVHGAPANKYHDVGNFAPGVTVTHSFLDPSGSPDQQLKIAKITFADGSTWYDGLGGFF
jgi:hypothetical protein